jgi:SAM-dependent methyltransferase
MHASVLSFIERFAPDVRGRSILEVGSKNINGSVRSVLEPREPSSYVGIDVEPGEGVDRVTSVEQMAFQTEVCGRPFDIVVSAEMLEHAQDWHAAFRAMAELLVPGGWLLLTTRSEGFPYHNPPDYWRFDAATLEQAARACGLLVVNLDPDPQVPGIFLKAMKLKMPAALAMPQPT